MYVRAELQERLTPPIYGWHNVRCPGYVAQEHIEFRRGPRKYEAGTHNLLGLVGLVAGLELILELGIDEIARELLRKRSWLVPAIQQKGFELLQVDAPAATHSCIISFHRPGEDTAALHKKLDDASIVTSLRTDRSGRKYIRLSPHFYNTDTELQRVLDVI
jgi:selenocysteine lyase/cysteine desulfurase